MIKNLIISKFAIHYYNNELGPIAQLVRVADS